ncbi:hypothetical protein SAMN05428949_1862 [Chitinophaga sp. YR627]|nr:hypothetical protein SAMN05428949_1862 [Chitinophaga sp. YR627]
MCISIPKDGFMYFCCSKIEQAILIRQVVSQNIPGMKKDTIDE